MLEERRHLFLMETKGVCEDQEAAENEGLRPVVRLSKEGKEERLSDGTGWWQGQEGVRAAGLQPVN